MFASSTDVVFEMVKLGFGGSDCGFGGSARGFAGAACALAFLSTLRASLIIPDVHVLLGVFGMRSVVLLKLRADRDDLAAFFQTISPAGFDCAVCSIS